MALDAPRLFEIDGLQACIPLIFSGYRNFLWRFVMRCGTLLGLLLLTGSLVGYGKDKAGRESSWVTGLVSANGETLHKFKAATGPEAMRKCQRFRAERRVPEERPQCLVLWSPDHRDGVNKRLWSVLEEVGTDYEDLPIAFFFATRRDQAQNACEFRRQQEFARRRGTGEKLPEEWEISCVPVR